MSLFCPSVYQIWCRKFDRRQIYVPKTKFKMADDGGDFPPLNATAQTVQRLLAHMSEDAHATHQCIVNDALVLSIIPCRMCSKRCCLPFLIFNFLNTYH